MEIKSQKTFTSLGYKSNLLKTLEKTEKSFDYFDPPFPLKINTIGHSFPPNSQIFMPMFELIPSKELIFQPSTLNQSNYQSLIIKNNSDTPLYYKFTTDISNIFRIYPKLGLIESKSFNLIIIEFCPKEIKSFNFPLKVVFNHDPHSISTINLYGLCSDPEIEIENTTEEIYFSPSFIGISTIKSVNIINKSAIKLNVQISPNVNYFNSLKSNNNLLGEKNPKSSKLAVMNIRENSAKKKDENKNQQIQKIASSTITINPSYFDMEPNQITKLDISMCPLITGSIENRLEITASRIYDPLQENYGIYNPGYTSVRNNEKQDRRLFKKTVKILGKGNDGELTIQPAVLDFGTVKVGFEKKLYFSIYNPSLCNFIIKLEIPKEENYEKILKLNFTEGLINSLCKKDVNLSFHPVTRSNIELKISLYALENQIIDKNQNSTKNFEEKKILKGEITIKANGDYPLLKIADIRNSNIGLSELWDSFNVDAANEELSKQLTEEEMNFINNDKANNRLQ